MENIADRRSKLVRAVRLSFNSKGVNIKGLANDNTYYIYIEYTDLRGKITRSNVIKLEPKKK